MPAPQWLLPAYLRSVTALGATAPTAEIEACGRDLIERWSSPDRKFHDFAHLTAVLERVDELADETHNPELVRVAAWYHGAVFDATVHTVYKRAVGENKEASAAHAVYELRRLGVPTNQAERVAELIRGLTRHDSDPSDVDSMALCDADLGILATEPQKYRNYRNRVRAEFAHVPVLDYLEARIKIVSALLARRRLFLSPLAEPWENAGRQNLTAELARLTKERGKILADPNAAVVPDETAAIPVIPPPIETPEQSAPSPTASPAPADDEEDAPELVGVPFEERPRVQPAAATEWGIERAPISERDIPRRESIIARAARPAGSAESPASTDDERASASVSTPREATESTGTLFRPIEDR